MEVSGVLERSERCTRITLKRIALVGTAMCLVLVRRSGSTERLAPTSLRQEVGTGRNLALISFRRVKTGIHYSS